MKCPGCGMFIPTTTRRKDHKTSRAAASKSERDRALVEGMVLRFMLEWCEPVTDEFLDAKLASPGQAESRYRRRRTDLTEQGLIEHSGYAVNSRGNRVKRWTLTLAGIAEAKRRLST